MHVHMKFEAPGVQIVEHARAIVAEDQRLGVRREDPALERLAKGSLSNADAWLHLESRHWVSVMGWLHGGWFGGEVRDSYAAFDSVGLRVKLDMSFSKIDEDPFYPWCKPTSFVKALDVRRRLDLLLPHETLTESKPVLVEYWKRFRAQFPDHEANDLPMETLSMSVPIRLHSDEGRRTWDEIIGFVVRPKAKRRCR